MRVVWEGDLDLEPTGMVVGTMPATVYEQPPCCRTLVTEVLRRVGNDHSEYVHQKHFVSLPRLALITVGVEPWATYLSVSWTPDSELTLESPLYTLPWGNSLAGNGFVCLGNNHPLRLDELIPWFYATAFELEKFGSVPLRFQCDGVRLVYSFSQWADLTKEDRTVGSRLMSDGSSFTIQELVAEVPPPYRFGQPARIKRSGERGVILRQRRQKTREGFSWRLTLQLQNGDVVEGEEREITLLPVPEHQP